ncbi:MAG: extracellular solute-binding protein [Thaumarchaeota archaeon]|nr:extracellular solute-binding protein [Nitrososphaerota archaeon]
MKTIAAIGRIVAISVIVIVIVAAAIGGYVLTTQTSSTTSTSSSIATSSSSVTTSSIATSSLTTSASTNTSSCVSNSTLYAAAKSEGVVYYYSSQTIQQLNALQSRFQAACPGITLQYQKLLGGPLTAELQNEFSSGKHVGDVVMATIDQAVQFEENGWLVKYIPLGASNISSIYRDPNGSFIGVRTPYFVIAYNSALVNQSQLPKSYMDLTNSRWQGKIAIADPYVLGSALAWFAAMKPVLGANWTSFVNGIHALHPILEPSNDVAAQAVASGQALIAITLTSSMYPSIQNGAPIAPLAVGPIVSLPVDAMILNGAPHPNAARLFEQWMVSYSTLQFFASFGDPVANGLAPPAFSQLVPLAQYHTTGLTANQTTQLETEMGLPWSG